MKQWLEKIKDLKRDQIMIILLAGVLLLVIALPAESTEEPVTAVEDGETESPADSYSEAVVLENKLKNILGQVEGIGRTEVMLTLKSEGKSIVEKDLEQSQRKEENGEEENAVSSSEISSSESTVVQKDMHGNEIPYVTEKLKPEIDGVLVIAQGAGSSSVAAEITEAVMALFGVPAHKIKVMKMK
ncbi:MAG: stage III sporulation protein AG [Lachnospiraceae bacterium]|nr:stage III sporulation protein AG [Lachnospiraceae bacterium]